MLGSNIQLHDDGTFLLSVVSPNNEKIGMVADLTMEKVRNLCRKNGLQFIIPNNEEIFDFIRTKKGIPSSKLKGLFF